MIISRRRQWPTEMSRSLAAEEVCSRRQKGLTLRRGQTSNPADEVAQHQFNIINTEQVIEHVPEPLALLKMLATSLADGAGIGGHNAYLSTGQYRHRRE